MNFTITIPKTPSLSLMEWMIKHKVSINVCSLNEGIMRAQNSLD